MFAIFHKTNNIGKYLWRHGDFLKWEQLQGHTVYSHVQSHFLSYCFTVIPIWQDLAGEWDSQTVFLLSFLQHTASRASLGLSLWCAVHPWEGNEKQPLFLHQSVICCFFNHSQMIGCSHISSLEFVCNLKFDCDSSTSVALHFLVIKSLSW